MALGHLYGIAPNYFPLFLNHKRGMSGTVFLRQMRSLEIHA